MPPFDFFHKNQLAEFIGQAHDRPAAVDFGDGMGEFHQDRVIIQHESFDMHSLGGHLSHFGKGCFAGIGA